MQQIMIWGRNGDLLAELLRHSVQFLVVGGVAVHLHVPSRDIANSDLDLLIESTPENVRRVVSALYALNSFANDVMAIQAHLAKPSSDPKKIPLQGDLYADLLTPSLSVDFTQEWQRSGAAMINRHQVRYASVDLLLRMKRGTDRQKDKDDVALLEALTP